MGSAWWQCTACLRAQEEDICELQLNHCNLYDVPPDVFIYERTLEKLYLDANRIKDLPRPLFQCHELRVLSLSDNEISTLPPAIASLINLEHLDLSKNNIKELPDSIKECKNLRSIDISVNPFERFPDAITHIVGLKELYINDAYIEYLPANFGRLSSLQTLELRENNMMTLPKSMSRLVNLQRLDIGNNEFTELPEVVGELTNLTELWIDGNDIRRIPLNIEQLYRLNHFDCTLNSVHVVPTEIQGWRDVSIINFSSNEIYQLPDSICYLRTIVTLKIDDNQLNELPNDIGQMSSLEELIVTKNFLEYLPSSLGLLRRLHCLNADNNYLKCLPPEIGSCTALSLLSLQSNNLTRIPAELGHLSSLTVLNLVNNSIKFLPVSLLNLTHLKALWLSDNQSQPLVPLQQDFNTEEDMMVLSCFMLPQKPRQDLEKMVQSVDPSSGSIIGTGRRICFAADVETELPRQLHRAPTPYPKELRNLARHARNLHHQNAHDRKIHLEQETLIKEATVTKSTPTIATKSGTCLTSSIKSADHYSTKYEKEHSNSEESSDEANKTVLAKEKNPDIREAKYIRNPTTEYLNKSPTVSDYVNSTTWKSEEYSETNTAKIVESEKLVVEATLKNTSIDGSVIDGKTDMVPLSPPPYHIAAAFSKKAALFQHLNFDQPAESPSAFEEKSTFNTPNISKNSILLSNSRTVENEPITTDTNANEDNQSISKPARLANLPTLTVEPKEEDSKAEDIYETDNKSLKPSKIPVLRAKHSELNNLSINEKSITDYENSNNFNFEPKDLPTSPVTGRKYRSPITQNCFKKNYFKEANLETRNFHEKESNQVGSEKSEKIEKVLLDHRLQEDFGGNNNDGDNSSQILENKPRFKWMFGPHRNANVLPVQVRKNPGLGFSIAGGVAGAETGIIITKVNPDGPAQGTLRPGDKILEVDGIDFTKSDHDNAVAVLRATGTVVSMMISRQQ